MNKKNSTQVGGDHYMNMGVAPWDVIDTWPAELQVGYHQGNALKYIMRAGDKGDAVQDLRKAEHCLAKLIEVLEAHRGNA
jgi:hypothetical protein